ncbi:MAG: phage integrase family protein [bacterium]|nr:MAG: phage integrase family protein [bacterium]KAF0147940.1 MAG: phage integrase family protein [bacterium]KAF0168122.1 MAG: phage integrase family protein [bacterium]TXT22581.1 MAG: phage integrase family protein [bacterium]
MGRTVAKQLTEMSILAAQRRARQSGNEEWLSKGDGLVARAMASGKVKFYRRYVSPTTGKRVTHYLADFDPDGLSGVSLAQASVLNADATRLLIDKIDPMERKAETKRREEAERARQEEAERRTRLEVTVGGLFEQWFENRIVPEFKKPDWVRRDVMGSVLDYAFKPDGATPTLFRDIPAKAVTRAHVVEIVEATQKRGANALANDQLRYLERMFSYAVTRDHLEISPFAKIEKRAIRKREQTRARALTREELRIVLRTLPEMRASWQVKGVIALALYSGQRTGYVCEMEWSEIVGDEWRIPAVKQKKEERRKSAPQTHVVYLPKQALELLERLRHLSGAGRFVFLSDRAEPGKKEFPISQASVEQSIGRHLRPMPGQGFRTDKREADGVKAFWDMPHFNAHDLRRSVATRMAEDVGIQPHVIERILNHAASNELAAIYNRATYEKERKAAAASWGKYLVGLVADNVLAGRFRKTAA